MKTKIVFNPLDLKPVEIKETKPTKSLRPTRSMSGIKSLRPKNLPLVANLDHLGKSTN
jgi:hypothetical protein